MFVNSSSRAGFEPWSVSLFRPYVLRILAITAALLNSGFQSPADAPTGEESPPVVEGQIFDRLGGGVERVNVILRAKNAPSDAPPIATTATDSFGDFHIHHDSPLVGAFEIVFRKDGYAEVVRDIHLQPDQPPPFIDLSLPGGLRLTGHVRDAVHDRPVPRADVTATVNGAEGSARTADDGSFAIEHVPPGPARIRVTADGYARAVIDLPPDRIAHPVRIALEPERIVEFKTLDHAGNPVPNVMLEWIDPVGNEYGSAVTDENGSVLVRNLTMTAGQILIRASHAAFVSDAGFDRTVELPGDQPRMLHRIALDAAARAFGTVTAAATGAPLFGVRIDVADVEHRTSARGWSDAAGHFEVAGARPGPNFVTAYLNGYAPDLKSVQLPFTGGPSVDFALGPARDAGGVVLDADGKPVAGAWLFATSWRGRPTLGVQALSDAEGRFSLNNLPDDAFTATVEAAGFDPLVGAIIAPGASDHRLTLHRRDPVVAPGGALKPGDAFPDFSFTTVGGLSLRTADLKGKLVLLDFWATWCAPCIAEVPGLRAIQRDFGERNDFQLIGISIDSDANRDAVRTFIKKNNMDWWQVVGSECGADGAARACVVSFIPQTVLISPDGKIISVGLLGDQLHEAIARILRAPSADP